MISITEEELLNAQKLIAALTPIVAKYKNGSLSRPFNILLDGSGYFYRENLHSQLIAAILKRPHFCKLFVGWINEAITDHSKINLENYFSPSIEVESEKIDILIQSDNAKHCIIIENKINGAPDMDRQIPRYIEAMLRRGNTIDAFVYLTLNDAKRPDKTGWTNEDNELLRGIPLLYLATSNNQPQDMLNGFLKRCLIKNQSMQEESYLKQYCDLIEFLGAEWMDNQPLSQFYEHIKSEANYLTVQKISALYSNLPTYRRDIWYQQFKNNYTPFRQIFLWSSNYTGFERVQELTTERLKMDVICEIDKTRIALFVQDASETLDQHFVENLLERMKLLEQFSYLSANRYECSFDFPTEDDRVGMRVREILDGLAQAIRDTHGKLT